MQMNKNEFNWSDIAFGSKKALRELNAIFIAAPREMSDNRLLQLIKQYLPIGNIIIGCADEEYIEGFDGQPQFKTLKISTNNKLVSKVNGSSSPHKITILHYRQSEICHILEKIKFQNVIFVNGSWKYSFHKRPEYYVLAFGKVDFEFVSPFADENEARKYAENFKVILPMITKDRQLTDIEMIQMASNVAVNSFDNTFQVGVSLGIKNGDGYKLLNTTFNSVVPYQTFAWHFGAQRDHFLSSSDDLLHYDTVHAETMMIIKAQKNKTDLKNTSLFINVLPCPNCARMLCESDISEIVYSLDHSSGYAVALLEKAGKKVRRLIDTDKLIKTEG
jgi:deoxycytidylate deaminase